jgi:GalNAc-alpha-(1->4)-GalNAc-alpha-(1->3)-diNAcBac-PP-undecaprenol alpha-1,4-N-acetyl-D-galactosaminyltransferase
MKIVCLISSLDGGGAERVLSLLMNHWAESQGHEVYVLTLRPEGHPPFYPLSEKIHLHQLGYIKGVDEPFFRKILRILRRLTDIRHALKTLAPDRIVSFTEYMNCAALLMGWGLKIPTLISERTDPRLFKIPLLASIARHLLYPYAHRLIVQSSSVRDFFPSLKDRITVLPNPVPPPSKYALHVETAHRIIALGRLDYLKGHDLLLTAFAALKSRFPNWSVEIYGSGPLQKSLEDQISSLQLTKCVFLKGQTKDVTKSLIRGSLFAFPSRLEGFPNALAEAMAVGLPVISSDCTGATDLVRSGVDGLLVPVGDVKALESALEQLMTNPALRAQMGTKAQEVTQRFNLQEILHHWDRLLDF